jgi:Domain of Unknown Function with PDB structure (DUF3858)/Transglutaminase-like superfamily
MRNVKTCILTLCAIVCTQVLQAQEKSSFKFGKVTNADFGLSADKFDSGANVLILADIGTTSYEGNDKAFFNIIYTRFLRVKIMNKNGFDIGSQRIYLGLDTGGNNEKLISLKGSTFNLENGIITETKLDDKSVFREKFNNDYEVRKFTLPALREGAIFDLAYTIKSPFPNSIKSWAFQGEYPRLWSEFEVTIPPVFHFVMKTQGDAHFDINTTRQIPVTYSIRQPRGIAETDLFSLGGNSVNIHWVKKNVPALREEPFITTLDNYYSKVSFQLNYFQWSDENEKHEYMTDWKSTSRELLEDEDFGLALNNENNWMAEELTNVVQNSNTEEESIHKIYNYVHDNFNAIGKDGYSKNGLYAQNSLKSVFKKKEGNVAEINLLLTSMLRKAGIHADPLILSTRDHGIAHAGYPLITEYNYVVCVATTGNKKITLDASQPFNGFGQIPVSCYNGWGHLINEENPLSINYSSDSLHETSVTNVIIYNDDRGKLAGNYKSLLGKSESNKVRGEISRSSLKLFEKKIQTENGSDLSVENFQVDSLTNFDFPITINYDFVSKNLSSADLLYFNPIVNEGYKMNPFKAMDRHYPVEIPYLIDDTYLLNMELPVGYKVDDMPKSARINYNGNEGFFEYLIQKGETSIQLRIHLKLNKAFFDVDEYQTLRNFFSNIEKKENEKIIIKKSI